MERLKKLTWAFHASRQGLWIFFERHSYYQDSFQVCSCTFRSAVLQHPWAKIQLIPQSEGLPLCYCWRKNDPHVLCITGTLPLPSSSSKPAGTSMSLSTAAWSQGASTPWSIGVGSTGQTRLLAALSPALPSVWGLCVWNQRLPHCAACHWTLPNSAGISI